MLLTVFTPTFNRGEFLEKCFESIRAQGLSLNLEWIIVDDGSTDNTREIVDGIISKSDFEIKYYYQENSGKQAAWNNALQKSRGEFFVGLDSDDVFRDYSIKSILEKYIDILRQDKKIIGIRALSQRTSDGLFDGKPFATESSKLSWFNEFSKSSALGERIDIFKRELLLNYLFPVGVGIRFIPEIWLYVRLSRDGYCFLYTNNVIRMFFDDHSSNRLSRTSLMQHALGHYISRSEMIRSIPMMVWLKNPLALIKTLIRLAQSKNFLKKWFDLTSLKESFFLPIVIMIQCILKVVSLCGK